MKPASLSLIICIIFIEIINVSSATISGVPPNSIGNTIVNQDTVWDGQNNIILGGKVIVGNATKRIYFNITNSNIISKRNWIMGGDSPVNFTLSNSTIELVVTDGISGAFPEGIMNLTQRIDVYTTTDLSKPSRFEMTNSTIRGTDYTHRGVGFYIQSGGLESGAIQQVKHTVITNNLNFSYLGGLCCGGYGYYAFSSGEELASDSKISNITLYYDGKGLKPSAVTDVDYITSIGGEEPFSHGRNWDYLIMKESIDGFQSIADGGRVRYGYFKSNEYKLNMGYTSSNTIFENSTFILCACNIGDGTPDSAGYNNTVRNNIFNQSGVGSRKNNTYILNNTFYKGMPTAGNIPINILGWNFLVANNTIRGGLNSIQIIPHYSYSGRIVGNHIIRDNKIIDTEGYGIYIDTEYNNTYINNTIIGSALAGIRLYDSNKQLFIDNNLTDSGVALDGSNGNVKWINNYIHNPVTIIGGDSFDNYYYADILVLDSDGNLVDGATLTIFNEVNNAKYPSINRDGNINSSFYTDASGHTKLPIGNNTNTVVLMSEFRNSTTTISMTYNITVFDPNHLYSSTPTLIFPNGTHQSLSPLATATVSPNESWYRPNPNTYQNTTVITINRTRTNISLKFDNGSINVSNATRKSLTATSDADQSYIVFKNTVPEYARRNVNFTVDGVFFANRTADASGFISFNYTKVIKQGSSHTFEWTAFTPITPGDEVSGDLNGDNIVDEKDVLIVNQHMGNLTWPPFPNYDVNQDGIVDILDMRFVTGKIQPSLIDQVYNYLKSLV